MPDTIKVVIGEDGRYDSKTADKVSEFIENLCSNLETTVIVTEEPDEICNLCCNYNGEICTAFPEDGLNLQDTIAKLHYGIEERSYTVREIRDLRRTGGKRI